MYERILKALNLIYGGMHSVNVSVMKVRHVIIGIIYAIYIHYTVIYHSDYT